MKIWLKIMIVKKKTENWIEIIQSRKFMDYNKKIRNLTKVSILAIYYNFDKKGNVEMYNVHIV